MDHVHHSDRSHDKWTGEESDDDFNRSETCRGMEPRPRITVVIAGRNTYKNSLRGMRKYHGLVIHTDRGFNTVVQPLIGVIIVEMLQTVSREGYMALFTYRKEVAMVMLEHKLGGRIIDVCLAANVAAGKCDTINKGYGFGDLTYEMILHWESATIALLGPHIMVEQQAEGVATEMATFYEDFYNEDGGTLLLTTMPVGILNIAFRFDHDPAETSL